MPMLDMPLEKLESYMGINPKPADFDEYWEKALNELASTPADVEFVPADFKIPNVLCYDLYFTGTRGARIHCRHLRPKKIEGKLKTMLLFHGYTGNAGNWWERAAYVQAGYAVYSIDVRGQGGWSQDTNLVEHSTLDGYIVRGLDDADPQKLFYRDVYLDCARMAHIAMAQDFYDPDRMVAFGGSQGGALTIACAALVPEVTHAAPMFPFLCDYKRVWEMDLDKDAYIGLKDYFRHFDPMHNREEEVFTKLGYIDLQFLAPRIKAKMLMLTGLQDNICPPSTQYAAYNKMTCEKYHMIYPDYGHETPWGAEDLLFQFMINDIIPEGSRA